MDDSRSGSIKRTSASHRFRVDPQIAKAFPESRLAVVIGYGLLNGPSTPESTTALAQAINELREEVGEAPLKAHPRILAWREIYCRFGAKPSKYLCSAEALASRALKGQNIPSINMLVDHYNALSIEHLIPIGGEDLDAASGEITLGFAKGGEQFEIPDDPSATHSVIPAGEVVWSDDIGVICRRWNWRQGKRTRMNETTKNAYFIIDAVNPSTTDDQFKSILDQFEISLQHHGKTESTEVVILL